MVGTTSRPIELDQVLPDSQTHLVAFWDQLTDQQRLRLFGQIDEIDFQLIERLFWQRVHEEDWQSLAERAQAPPALRLDGTGNKFDENRARARGEHALRNGQVGVILVAGGQGTRLGFPHPKGMYPLGPLSQRTLYQIHVDRLLAMARRYGTQIPLLVMTSPVTHEPTLAYFEQQGSFSLDDDLLHWFRQGTMPSVDKHDGKILLTEPGRISLSPDGHGGMLAALNRDGLLEEVSRRGIKYLFYLQVDNPLVAIGDPVFIGYHILAGSELTSQVVAKTNPLEKVGNVVSIDGSLRIIEYSDLPADLADRRNADGNPIFWAGSIAVHVFDVDFLQRVSDREDVLPFHVAYKRVPHVGPDGQRVVPSEPNAIKFERFIFDLLPEARNAIVVEVDPSQAFAPIKNASSVRKDSPDTARLAMVAQHREWLQSAGIGVADNVIVEINPRFALDANELATKLSTTSVFVEDTYLC